MEKKTVQTFNRNIVERGQIDTSNTQLHMIAYFRCLVQAPK